MQQPLKWPPHLNVNVTHYNCRDCNPTLFFSSLPHSKCQAPRRRHQPWCGSRDPSQSCTVSVKQVCSACFCSACAINFWFAPFLCFWKVPLSVSLSVSKPHPLPHTHIHTHTRTGSTWPAWVSHSGLATSASSQGESLHVSLWLGPIPWRGSGAQLLLGNVRPGSIVCKFTMHLKDETATCTPLKPAETDSGLVGS